MNFETIFLTFGAAYLALVTYGVIGTRKRALPVQIRIAAAAAQVILPPLILFGALAASADGAAIGGWAVLLAMLLVAGALLALCTDIVARRVL